MTKLLQISALSALTFLFAACDVEMTEDDVETRDVHGKRLDYADVDGDVDGVGDEDEDEDEDGDDGFIIDDDFADAEPVPAPIVEYDLAAEDEEPCDSWGPENDDHFAAGAADEDAYEGEGEDDVFDADLPIGVNPEHSEETWGPDEDLDLDHGDVEDDDVEDDDDA